MSAHVLPGTVFPIPAAALDDRLGFIGNTGSGKTYGAGVGVEQLLADRRRVVVADPLGVWWGLRLRADGASSGSPSGFDVVIFGGPRGDVAITENAGAIVGEAVATMKESAIVDLSELGTRRAERRFMRHFLSAFYKHATGEPVHLVLDEADMWAPQRVMDKEGGDALALLGQMETIVRRGRVKGFIPWLITQRPAVLNKDVLSQVDGLAAFKLTSLQDRKALGAWIEGQADREEGKKIFAMLAELERGRAVIWLPARGIIKPATFPKKVTFDSSRTPKRGEKREDVALQPLDLGTLRDRLAKVETEAKANDPAALKKKIAELERTIASKSLDRAVAKEQADAGSFQQGFEEGRMEGIQVGWSSAREHCLKVLNSRLDQMHKEMIASATRVFSGHDKEWVTAKDLRGGEAFSTIPSVTLGPAPTKRATWAPPAGRARVTETRTAGGKVTETSRTATVARADMHNLTAPQEKVVRALKWWGSVGEDMPSRAQIAAVAGYAAGSGNWNNILGGMKSAGLIDYPSPGFVQLIGLEHGLDYPDAASVRETFRKVAGGPGWKVLEAIKDGSIYSRQSVGDLTGYAAGSGNFNNILGSLRSIGAIDYPQKGMVQINDWAKEIVT